MGEKDITPAGGGSSGALTTPAPTSPGGGGGGAGGFMGVLDDGPPETQAGGGHTAEKPGTSTPAYPNVNMGGPTEMSDLFDDGYRASRDTTGTTTLTDPSGTTATWDESSKTWVGADGKAMPPDWSGGHDPRDYTTSKSN